MSWEIWLCDPTGYRLNTLTEVQSFGVSRIAGRAAPMVMYLPKKYDNLIGLDYIVEFWRSPIGGAAKLFNAYFIRRWSFQENNSGTDVTKVWGYDGNYLLSSRIVAYASESAEALKTDYLDDMMKAVVRENLGASATGARNLTSVGGGFTVQADLSAAPSVTRGFAWDNVLDTMQSLANVSRSNGTNLYFDVVPSFTSAGRIAWQFQTFTGQRGQDRTADSNHPAVFGREWGNLEGGYFEYDHSEEANYIYGRGQGRTDTRFEGDAEDTTRQGRSIWNLREAYANAAAGGGGESDASTQADAESKLDKMRPKWRGGGRLLDTGQTRYDIDYTFGDSVTLDVRKRQFDAEVLAVNFSVDEDGQEVPDILIDTEGV